MNKMSSDLHADEALTGMSNQDDSTDEEQKKPTGTALVAVPALGKSSYDLELRHKWQSRLKIITVA